MIITNFMLWFLNGRWRMLFDHWNFETYQRDIGIKSP